MKCTMRRVVLVTVLATGFRGFGAWGFCDLEIPKSLIPKSLSSAQRPTLSEELQTAFVHAGDNKSQLQAALEQAPADQKEGMEFLIAQMPKRDLQTLSAEFLLENADFAYRAVSNAPWAKQIPKQVFLNNVLPYANVNERRDRWRKDFYERFFPLVKDCKTPAEAAHQLNRSIFKELEVKYSRKRLKPDQSPYESMETGLASCTGLAILLIDACRAVGVPARFVGTPLWADRSGNHSWVEVWDHGWHFTGAAEPSPQGLDHAWFVHRASQAKHDPPRHAIYAVSYKRTPLRFPLVWSRRADYVYAVDVTDRYTQRKEPSDPKSARISIRVVDRRGGSRVAADVRIVDVEIGQTIFQGVSKDERFDLNDYLVVPAPIDKKYRIELRHRQRQLQRTFTPTQQETRLEFCMADGQESQDTSKE